MHHVHAARLRCIACSGALTAVPFAEDGSWIEAGYLACTCGAAYPIIDGLPRMLPPSRILAVAARPAIERWTARFGDALPPALRPLADTQHADHGKDVDTANYYAWMWQHYDTVFDADDREELERLTAGRPARELVDGKDVIDIGGGQGRFVVSLLEKGARSVVCLDLGEAIGLACRKFRDDERVLCVQADLYSPPVGADFDLVHCIGVLQHLPDPERGFAQLVSLARPGGHVLAWCYGDSAVRPFVQAFRAACNALPIRWIWRVAGVLGGARYAMSAAGSTLRSVGLDAVAARLPLAMYQGYSFDYLRINTFDHLSAQIINFFRREDLDSWMARARPERHRIEQRFPGRAASSWLIEATR